MRIIYDFSGKDPQVSGSGTPWSMGIWKPPEYAGFRAELMLVDCDQPKDGRPFREGDAIYIEGDGASIITVLEAALQQMRWAEEIAQQQAAEQIARTEQCPACTTWFDTKGGWHADGHGKRCPASREQE